MRASASFHLALALAGITGLAGCSDAMPTQKALSCEERPVRMGVASSLRDVAELVAAPLAKGGSAFRVERIFGASSTHARQLRLGAPFDLLVSADAELIEALAREGWVVPASMREIAGGALILVAREKLPGVEEFLESSTAPNALTQIFEIPKVRRVALPSETVPLGRYANAWLRKHGLEERLDGKIVRTEHARATLSAVEAGHADLAFAYQSDQGRLRNASVVAHLDPKDYPEIRYLAALTPGAAPCPGPAAILNAWTSPKTQTILAAAGFIPAAKTSTPPSASNPAGAARP